MGSWHRVEDTGASPVLWPFRRRQIEASDHASSALVYELYGLTEQEIAIVEGRHN